MSPSAGGKVRRSGAEMGARGSTGGGGRRWRWCWCVAVWLVLLSAGFARGAPPPAAEPAEGPGALDITPWISRMWEPIAVVSGPLTDERRDDVVLVLHRQDELPNDPILPIGSRGLAIFSRGADGRYQRAALLEGFLPCVLCMGTLSRDPLAAPFEIDIADRRLSVSWISSADGLVYVRLELAWDPREQAFGLVTEEVVRAERLGGIKSRRLRDYRTGRAETDGLVTRFTPHFVPAERIRAEDYR